MDRLRRSVSATRGAIAAIVTIGLVVGVVSSLPPLQRAITTLPRPLEPLGLVVRPEGEDVSRLTPVMVTFPKEPDASEPDRLLQLEPAVKGSFAWMTPRTLLFQPDFPGLLRGSTYTIHVPSGPATGLNEDVRKKFTVAGLLEVQQVIPGDGDIEVPTNAQVMVQFSRSVAPLTTLSAQRTDPVIRFDPPLEGKGEWLNTSIYRFIPTALLPSTTYRVRIGKGLTSAADGYLQDDVAWSFTTITPHVASIAPADNTLFASPSQNVDVTFDQAMDPSAASGIVVHEKDGPPAPGIVRWDPTFTTATFVPSGTLKLDTVYIVAVEKGSRGARGGETPALRNSSFRTVALPRVIQTAPRDGETAANRFGVSIRFNNPMDRRSLEGKLRISGFTADELEGRVFIDEGFVTHPQCASCPPNGGGMSANVALKPSTRYTVDLLTGAVDRYGQPLGAQSFSFTTGEMQSSVSLVLPGYAMGTTYSATAEPILWFQATNTPTVDFTLWPLTPDEGSRILHGIQIDMSRFEPSLPVMRRWSEKVDAPRNEVALRSTSIGGGGALPKGYYFVRTSGQFRSQFAFAVVDTVIVTKLSTNELLAWALDHDTGKPLPGMTLRAFGPDITPAEVVTDASGLASFSPFVPTIERAYGDRSYWVTTETGGRYGVASTRWTQGTAPYSFGIQTEYQARNWVGQVYTDRPLYRPGETVNFKVIVRKDDDASYSLPPSETPLELVLMNARGQEIRKEKLQLGAFGTYGGSFEIPADAPIGDYSILVRMMVVTPAGGSYPIHLFSNSYRVAEFRKPEYQVEVTTGKASYVDGDAIDVRTKASFFFGGALADAPVAWSAVAAPFTIRVKGYEQWSFADLDVARSNTQRDATRASGTAKTDADGVASFSLPAALVAGEGAQRYTIGANVSDVSGQAVAGVTEVTVHAASLYAGVKPSQYVASVGTEAGIQVVSVDTDGVAVGGQRIALKVYDRRWITTRDESPEGGRRFTSTPKDELLGTLDVTTDAKGEGRTTFKPTKAGTLRLVAEITDAKGRVARSAAYLWVSGGEFALWQFRNDDTIQLIADKDRYEVGDTAEILVPAPFTGATALVTVERGKVITRTVTTLATNSERLRIPITDRSVPNVFVSVVLYRGPTATDAVPKYKVGYVHLPVSTVTRKLTVTARPDREQAKPGETVRYDISVTDHTGKGVRSEVSVAVVDKALLSLEDERGPDGLKAFWFERGLAVSTGSSMSVSMDRANDLTADIARQGKGGGGFLGDRPRQEFKNVAYWTAQLVTNDDGTARVDVKMPDNLTTWRMAVRAVSGDTLVGEGTNELLATQPLLLRPALPRFLRVGDSAEVRVLVTNATKAASAVEVRVAAEGVKVTGDLRKASIGPGATQVFSWPATVDAEGTARFAFTATGSGGLSDAISLEIPVLMDVTPETMATGGIVTDRAGIEAIYLPPFAKLKPGSLTINVRSALVSSLAEELEALAPRGPEGTERIASRLIATIGVRRAEKSATGVSSTHDGRIASDTAAVLGRQRPDGGWPWCDDPLCPTDPKITAWALLALGEARREGTTIDAGVIARASSYVLSYILRPTDVASPADPSDKAFMLAALAAAGGGDRALTPARALFEQQRAQLTSWGRAYLVLALDDAGVAPDDTTMRALLNDIAAASIPSANGNHWEDKQVRGGFMTSTSTTGLVALALARVRPDQALLPQSVRWLVVARGAQGWHTSIDRAMGVLGLTTYAAKTGELGGEYSYSVTLGERSLLTGSVTPATPLVMTKAVPLTTFTPGKFSILAFSRDFEKQGRLYYTLDLRYVTPAQGIEAVNRGFAVSHEFTSLTDPTKPITSVKVGETVRVKVTVMAPASRKYVTVEDLLPAGLEAIDARLKTVDPQLKKQLEAERLQIAQKASGSAAYAPWYGWYYSPWQFVELRDDRAVLYAQDLSKGVYEYVYYARATTPGDFFTAPPHAEEAYFPEVFGRGDSGRFTVTK
ncbi:MAG TPA: Ig-like domain-containing protein [Candidatus Limnocylindria bacterium]